MCHYLSGTNHSDSPCNYWTHQTSCNNSREPNPANRTVDWHRQVAITAAGTIRIHHLPPHEKVCCASYFLAGSPTFCRCENYPNEPMISFVYLLFLLLQLSGWITRFPELRDDVYFAPSALDFWLLILCFKDSKLWLDWLTDGCDHHQ